MYFKLPEGGDSFIWFGDLSSQKDVKEWFRWVLGDGTQINAFRDPWLRLKEGFCVENSPSNDHRKEKVSASFMTDLKR